MLRFDLNFPRVLIAGCGSFFEYRLTNEAAEAVANLQVTLTCHALGLVRQPAEIASLLPGDSRVVHVDVLPESAGAPLLRIQVEGVVGRSLVTWEGVGKDVFIAGRPESVSSISVVVQDIQSHRSQGEKAGFGAVAGDANINISNLLPPTPTLNDLLKLRLPDEYVPVHLQTLTPGPASVVTIPPSFLGTFEPADVVELIRPDVTLSEEVLAGWRLCAGPHLVIGRSSMDCDVPARFLPSSPENAKRSGMLSRRQAVLHMAADGRLEVENVSRSGGLVFAGTQNVRFEEKAPLSGGVPLCLGNRPGELQLTVQIIPPIGKRRLRCSNWDRWGGCAMAGAPPWTEPDWGRANVRFLNTSPAFWQPLWFAAMISFGSSLEADLCIPDSDLEPVHGYFHRTGRCFWIENAAAEGNGVLVNAKPLACGEMAPLRDGARLVLGSVALKVQRIR